VHAVYLFVQFHHRDPGIVGLLTSQAVGDAPVYYSLIADGNHTHKTVQKIAYKAHPDGAVLVTDAVSGMGVSRNHFSLGEVGKVEVVEGAARLAGTTTLAGSVATMDQCVCQFMRATGCTKSQALQAASLHPATVLRLPHRGTLEPGMAADLVILDQEMNVQATCIAGEPVWTLPGSRLHRESLAQLEQAMQI
jgi:N-acetylglucosamine-6-phosphate deacetylase